jgi:predicted RNA-binding Zn-ribbon protein involved in translation (DUF1610 family)
MFAVEIRQEFRSRTRLLSAGVMVEMQNVIFETVALCALGLIALCLLGRNFFSAPTSRFPEPQYVTNTCPNCGGSFEFLQREIGRDWKCPHCGIPVTLRESPLMQAIPKKSELLGALLGLVLGPLGFFYVGWRYGLSAICFYGFYVFFIGQRDFLELVQQADLGILYGLLHVGGIGTSIATNIRERNKAIVEGDRYTFENLSNTGMAVLWVAFTYPLIAFVVFLVQSIVVTVKSLMHGHFFAAFSAYCLQGLLVFNLMWVVKYVIYGVLVLLLIAGCEFVFCRNRSSKMYESVTVPRATVVTARKTHYESAKTRQDY